MTSRTPSRRPMTRQRPTQSHACTRTSASVRRSSGRQALSSAAAISHRHAASNAEAGGGIKRHGAAQEILHDKSLSDRRFNAQAAAPCQSAAHVRAWVSQHRTRAGGRVGGRARAESAATQVATVLVEALTISSHIGPAQLPLEPSISPALFMSASAAAALFRSLPQADGTKEVGACDALHVLPARAPSPRVPMPVAQSPALPGREMTA